MDFSTSQKKRAFSKVHKIFKKGFWITFVHVCKKKEPLNGLLKKWKKCLNNQWKTFVVHANPCFGF